MRGDPSTRTFGRRFARFQQVLWLVVGIGHGLLAADRIADGEGFAGLTVLQVGLAVTALLTAALAEVGIVRVSDSGIALRDGRMRRVRVPFDQVAEVRTTSRSGSRPAVITVDGREIRLPGGPGQIDAIAAEVRVRRDGMRTVE